MEIFKDFFDSYGRQARLQPALFTLFPVILTALVWAPSVYTLGAGLVGILATCGVLAFLAHWARARGRTVEKSLHTQWGGKPTASWLRHRDKNLDPTTKTRYCAFLQSHIDGWTPPTPEDENNDVAASDERYDSAVRWLLEYTRDKKKFPLVFKEVISYGFRRNLYGLKWFGFLLALGCTAANIVALTKNPDVSILLGGTSLAVSLGYMIVWLFVIRPKWVKDAADAYAKTLLSACETV